MANISLAKLLFEDADTKSSITMKKAQAIFKYFHLSMTRLGAQTFTFTPRLPRTPYMDDHENIIEDDFTKRISLAPSINKALEALGYSPGAGSGFHVYAGDIKPDPTDDIQAVDLSQVSGPAYIDQRTRKLQRYDTEFKLASYIKNQTGANSVVAKPERPLAPSKLNEPFKSDFEYAVPDAKKTKEMWSVEPITMIYLGMLTSDNMIRLADYARDMLLEKGLISQTDLKRSA